MIDANVFLSRWPFRRLAGDEPAELAEMLRRQGVTRAWAGSFDALLHKDVAAVNARLAEDCRRSGGLLVPFGAVNPTLPDWEEDLRRCAEEHRMAGIRLHPNYHGYTLAAPEFARLLRLASERRLVVQIALKMEDERTQHPLVRVPNVDLAPLPALLAGLAGARVAVANGLRDVRGPALKELTDAGVSFDIGMLEAVGGLGRVAREIGAGRLLFGSYAPYFVFESALLKLRESVLDPGEARGILEENARRLLAGR